MRPRPTHHCGDSPLIQYLLQPPNPHSNPNLPQSSSVPSPPSASFPILQFILNSLIDELEALLSWLMDIPSQFTTFLVPNPWTWPLLLDFYLLLFGTPTKSLTGTTNVTVRQTKWHEMTENPPTFPKNISMFTMALPQLLSFLPVNGGVPQEESRVLSFSSPTWLTFLHTQMPGCLLLPMILPYSPLVLILFNH